MIRYLCVIVDKSGAMDAKDLKPNRKLVTAEMVLASFHRRVFYIDSK